MLPALIATLFVGLLIVAATAAALSSILVRNAPPLRRSAVTALAAWVLASAALHFLPSAYEARIWERPLFLLPFAVIVWFIMWRSFALYWQEDAEIEAAAAAEEAKVWPALADQALPAAAPAPERRSLWAVRHWRGEISLPVSYWVNSVLVVFLVTVLAGALVRGVEVSGAPLQALSAAALLFLVGTLLLWAWGAVGTWRSATCHEDHGGSGGWAIAAQVMVALGAFLTFLQVQNYAFQSLEFGALAFGGDPLGAPAEVMLGEDGTTIRIDGMLTSGTSGRFRAVAAEAPRLRSVLLDSPGGRQLEALRIAETIRQRGLATRVERECLSACTFILLAGRERTADQMARIGFHQPSFPGWTESERRMGIREMGEDYRKAGLGEGFVEQAMATPAEAMWMPHHDELAAARVLTAAEIATGEPRIYREMSALAKRLNARLPVQIDRTTRFESVEAWGPTLVHHFTVARPRETVDRRNARIAIGQAALRQVCAVEANLDALEDGASFVYLYRDREQTPLFQITLRSCGG
ncbi:MAG TPA: hypothetical protein VGB79_13080 [Allosphingosinicella sp.]